MGSLSGSHSNHMEKREPIDLAAGATAVTAPSPTLAKLRFALGARALHRGAVRRLQAGLNAIIKGQRSSGSEAGMHIDLSRVLMERG